MSCPRSRTLRSSRASPKPRVGPSLRLASDPINIQLMPPITLTANRPCTHFVSIPAPKYTLARTSCPNRTSRSDPSLLASSRLACVSPHRPEPIDTPNGYTSRIYSRPRLRSSPSPSHFVITASRSLALAALSRLGMTHTLSEPRDPHSRR